MKTLVNLDLLAILEASGGIVTGNLVDAGMTRPFRGEYEFALSGTDLQLRSKKNSKNRAVMPRYLNLTPELLCFFGLYSGDGNKSGLIGYASETVDLLEAACRGFKLLFGPDIDLQANLLNDSRYFMRPEFSKLVRGSGINPADLPIIKSSDIPQSLRDHLKGEFLQQVADYPILSRIRNHSVTISPKKGARKPGQESREYIINITKSSWLLPILLVLIEFINESLAEDTRVIKVNNKTVLDWGQPPSSLYFAEVDLDHHMKKSITCRWFTPAGIERRYNVDRINSRTLRVNDSFNCQQICRLGPITSYAAGLYLAEGTTNKKTLLHFNEPAMKGSKVALSFNSTENLSLAIFIKSLRECLGIVTEGLTSWKVKVGSAYMYEMQVVGEMFQTPMVRKGMKGQGVSRSCVQAGFARDWAIKEFPELKVAIDKFSHIEYTGAGVPRIQINCSSSPARLLFSLYRKAANSLLEVHGKK